MDIPTGFSPNGDGINDYVQIRGYGIEKVEFRIYNRWGENVFKTTNVDDKWFGDYKGQQQEMDVFSYFAIITFTDQSVRTLKGNISLVR